MAITGAQQFTVRLLVIDQPLQSCRDDFCIFSIDVRVSGCQQWQQSQPRGRCVGRFCSVASTGRMLASAILLKPIQAPATIDILMLNQPHQAEIDSLLRFLRPAK